MRPKERCKQCGRVLKKKHFRLNRKTKTRMCKSCIKRVGENIFYTPEIKNKKIKKIYFHYHPIRWRDEEKVLKNKFYKEGLGEKEIKMRLKKDKTFVNNIKKIFRNKEKKEEINKQKLNINFLEGLK